MQAAYVSIPTRQSKKSTRLSILAPRLIRAKREESSWSWSEFKRWKIPFFLGLLLVSLIQGYQGFIDKRSESSLFQQPPTLKVRVWIYPMADIPTRQGRARIVYHGNFAIPTGDGREVIVRGGDNDGNPYGVVRAFYPALLRFAQKNGRRGTDAGLSVDQGPAETKSQSREKGWIVDNIRLARSIDRDPPMYYAVDFPPSQKFWLGVALDAFFISPLAYFFFWVSIFFVWQLALWLSRRLMGTRKIDLRLGRPNCALNSPMFAS